MIIPFIKRAVGILLIPVLSIGNAVLAQPASSLVQTEYAFARTAVEKSVKKAFLSFLDSSGIVFSQGRPKNGLQVFSRAPETKVRLVWKPAFVCVSSSGDIGFTTGPFEEWDSTGNKVISRGQFNSIWRKNEQGEWKLILDIGNDLSTSRFIQTAPLTNASACLEPPGHSSEIDIESNFIVRYREKGNAAFKKFITRGTRLHRHRFAPAVLPSDLRKTIRHLPDAMTFIPMGDGTSQAGDLKYAYGIVQYKGISENYLRIWGHTKQGWKLLLQSLRL